MNWRALWDTFRDVFLREDMLWRLPNMLKVLSGYALSRVTGKPFSFGRPFMLMLEPANICNLRCPLCIIGQEGFTRPVGMMDFEPFKRVLDNAGPDLMHLTLWNQGEPFLNPDIMRMIAEAKRRNLILLTSTNGFDLEDRAKALTLSGLDEIIVSMDGASPQTYEQYRKGGDFNKVARGLQALATWKKRLGSRKPRVELQFIIMRQNEHEIERMKQLAAQWKVDRLALKTVQVRTREEAQRYLPKNPVYRRYSGFDDDGVPIMKGRMENWCRWLFLCPVVNQDGMVAPCCFDKDGEYILGDATRQSMRDIWQGKPYQNFRKAVQEGRARIPMCRNCSEGLGDMRYDREKTPAKEA